MRSLSVAIIAASLSLAACSEKETPTQETAPEIAVSPESEISIEAAEPQITKDVLEKVAHLMKITANGQLTPLVREAERNENFQSNFGGQSHSRHWFLLRRVGVDPATTLRETLDQPFGAKRVGNELWFIWPDFAALSPEDLIPERLDFQDRARLLEMIGEDGVAQIRAGEPYPGVRTAISDSGRWVYFIHDINTNEDP